MKIGILGTNSYIGRRFSDYISGTEFHATFISCRDDAWNSADFSSYGVLLCPIGIAHVSTDPALEEKYYAVNRDLPVAIAKKAKADGVKQFVFFSSMIVYGKDLPAGKEFVITAETKPNPENFYGKSKLEAEEQLLALADESFFVSVLRIPMVYGPNCKGNFPRLLQVAKKSPICPSIQNRRSMIYVGNLCEYLALCVKNPQTGIFFPQNAEYVSTVDVIRTAAKYFNHRILFTGIFNPLLRLAGKKLSFVNKIFGTKIYDSSLSPNCETYNKISFEDSIKACVEASR